MATANTFPSLQPIFKESYAKGKKKAPQFSTKTPSLISKTAKQVIKPR